MHPVGLAVSAAAAGVGGGEGGGGSCLPLPIVVADVVLAVIDAAIAAVAFAQLLRIHWHNQQLGWTRQKIFHLMIGLCNIATACVNDAITSQSTSAFFHKWSPHSSDEKAFQCAAGFLAYFMSTIVATCERWLCWLHGCGFVLMACPQILFLAAFLLLLSFWVDLCHQTNDEDEEDVRSYHEALLDRAKTKPGAHPVDVRRRCCSFQSIQLGSRQKFVILVIVLAFVIMFTFAILIWVGRGENPIDSSALKRVYLDIFSVVFLVLGGALACYGALLFSKMSKVRSETVSTEKWKVTSLAAVSLVCFTSSAVLALVTNVPVLLSWYSTHASIISSAVLMFVYYFIGSSVPSGFVLWVMREMPPRQTADRPVQARVITLFRDRLAATQNPQWRTAVASSNKALKSSPI